MIKSMTAYGRGQSHAGDGLWIVELRTVNSRFLDSHLRLPPFAAGLEERIKKHLARRLSRGRVNLSINASGIIGASPRLVLNLPLVREYARILDELKEELAIDPPPHLGPFLLNRELVAIEDVNPDLDQLWAGILPALDAALDEAEVMRKSEGQTLAEDLRVRLKVLEDLFEKAAARAPLVVENYRAKLEERVAKLAQGLEPDPQRLATEIAIMAEKCDITEETVRAKSHLEQFRVFLGSDGPVGRKLDFLLQELNREANTTGSKLPDAVTGHLAVDIKAELERLREQVQNIE